MGDAISRIALGQEALTDLVEASQIGVEDLDCDAVAVAVRRLEHGRHAANANQAVEPPFAEHQLAETRAGRARALIDRHSQTRSRHPKRNP
jgi:hypothetical protein